mmetsp:Transcript_62201/g.166552  ORF Transcript_62201/g.166552 Transcript_62201/m.166552 type:complete len:157 (+) Transcript_62201:1144-1614(+)
MKTGKRWIGCCAWSSATCYVPCDTRPQRVKLDALREARGLMQPISAGYASCCSELAIELSRDTPKEDFGDVWSLLDEADGVFRRLALEHGESYGRHLQEYGHLLLLHGRLEEAEARLFESLEVFGVARTDGRFELSPVLDRTRVRVAKCLKGLRRR